MMTVCSQVFLKVHKLQEFKYSNSFLLSNYMESQGIHTVMQLNKDVEQSPFILTVLFKIKNGKHRLIRKNQKKKSEFIQSALHSCLKTVLENNPENEYLIFFSMLHPSNLYLIYHK